MLPDGLRLVDTATADMSSYTLHLADCVVLTQDGKLLMQQRPLDWGSSAGCLTTFGGHVETGETPLKGLVRELKEELGVEVDPAEVVFIGALTEDWTQHKELVHVYFWHDRKGTITGCYEAEPRHYDRIEDALAHPKIMDYARWAVTECRSRRLV
jgi:8-oxo-dGTP diphosphatase